MIWFTADTHFGHKNIIEYVQRPFSGVEDMDAVLIDNWNKRVGLNDEVYHLGDVGLCSPNRLKSILHQLNGKIYLIRGNHEKSAESCNERFEWIKDYFELVVPDEDGYNGEQLVVLFHYSMRVWQASHYGSYQLYGHTHGELFDDPALLSMDVGVDCNDFYPVSYADVKNHMKKKGWTRPDLR